jgi:hypothetical protein
MLEAVPSCSYTQIINAKLVIAVPKEDTACELHRIKKSRRPSNIFVFFMALLLQILLRMRNAKPDSDGSLYYRSMQLPPVIRPCMELKQVQVS